MSLENIIVMIIIVILLGLFVFRIIKSRKIHDISVLLILILCIIVRLPIGKSIPKLVIVCIVLGLAVVTILSYLKTKNDALKEAMKSNNDN